MRVLKVFSIISVITLVVLLATSEISDPDTMQYLASGKYIVEHGLPQTCIFTYTLTRCITVYSEWLLYLLVYGLFLAGSWRALVSLQIFVALSIFSLAYLHNKRIGVSVFATSVIALPAAIVASMRFMLRADFVALLPMAIVYTLVTWIIDREFFPHRKRLRNIVFTALFFTMVVWANTHGSFPLAFVIIGAFSTPHVLACIRVLFSGRKLNTNQVNKLKWATVMVLTCIAGSLINPYGIKAFFWPFKNTIDTMGAVIVRTISEYESPWEPTDFVRFHIRVYKFLSYLAGLLFITRIRRLRAEEVAILAFFFWLSVQGYRYIAGFAVIAALILPHYLDGLFTLMGKIVFTKATLPRISTILSFTLTVTFVGTGIWYGSRIVNNSFYVENMLPRRFGVGLLPVAYPEGAVKFILDNKPAGNIFNSYGFGSYLNWALYPQYKTFVHGAVLDLDIVDSVWLYKYYRQVKTLEVDTVELLTKYGVTILFIEHTNSFSIPLVKKLYRDNRWKLVYADFNSLIYLANVPSNAQIIANNTVPLQDIESLIPAQLSQIGGSEDLATAYTSIGALLSNLNLTPLAIEAYQKALTFYPDSFVIYGNLGSTYHKSGQDEKALAAYEQSIALNPSHAAILLGYGRILVELGRLLEGIIPIKRAIQLNPNNSKAHETLAEALNRMGDHRGALSHMVRAREIKERPIVYLDEIVYIDD